MLHNVSMRNRMTTHKHVTVLNRQTEQTAALTVPSGMLSIAGQVLGGNRSATLAESSGFEIAYADVEGMPSIQLLRHTAMGDQHICSVSVQDGLIRSTHTDPMFVVSGLSALAAHIVSRGHSFVPRSIAPMPSACSADPATVGDRIRAMQLEFAGAPEQAKTQLATLGTICQADAPPLEASCVYTGADKYKSFFMFNSRLVSRLSSLFERETLCFARGVCLNMALGHHMLADEGCVVHAETLSQGAVASEVMAGLTAARGGEPCCCLQYLRSGGGKQSVLVYDISEQVAGVTARYVMFSEHGSPVVVSHADAKPVPPAKPPPPMAYSAFRVAVRDMLFLHGASGPRSEFAQCRHALKNASFQQHAPGLSATQRAKLYVLSRQDSPGVYGMACECEGCECC